jgi:hypothetical protein
VRKHSDRGADPLRRRTAHRTARRCCTHKACRTCGSTRSHLHPPETRRGTFTPLQRVMYLYPAAVCQFPAEVFMSVWRDDPRLSYCHHSNTPCFVSMQDLTLATGGIRQPKSGQANTAVSPRYQGECCARRSLPCPCPALTTEFGSFLFCQRYRSS